MENEAKATNTDNTANCGYTVLPTVLSLEEILREAVRRQATYHHIPILDFYAGDYRLEYDGKYVTLFGKDKNYKGFKFNDEDDDWFEEMVLIPVVEEIRNASPKIIEVTDTDIVVDLGCP